MDKGLLIRQLADQLGVTEDTVINWEVRGIRPCGKPLGRIKDIVPEAAGFVGSEGDSEESS